MALITALNGRIPATMLTVADTGANGSQRLRIDAAASWGRMIAAGMPAGCLRSGYRTLAEQRAQDPALAQQRAQDPNLALAAGQSFHGEGIAADFDEPARTWIARHGLPFGWRIGFVPGEPWHAQYDQPDRRALAPVATPTSTPEPAPLEDQDMLILRTPQHGIYTVTPGAVVAHVSGKVSSGLEFRGKAQVMDVNPDDLAEFIFATSGCPKASIPAPGYMWRA